MKRFVMALALLLATAAVVDAGCFVVRKAVVKQDVVLAQLVALAYYPIYGQPQQPSQLSDDLLRRLVEAVEKLEARIDGGQAATGSLTMESIVGQACAKCHTAGKNPQGGFVLVDEQGKLAELSIGDRKVIALRTATTDPKLKMPPEKSLSEAAKKVVAQAMKQ